MVTEEAIREAVITDHSLVLITVTAPLTAPDGVFTERSLSLRV